ncbi:MAG: serine hydrolase [Bryobacteraceae bacterium]|nr:serine hydrolase [Bryobacteraceae bacterium]
MLRLAAGIVALGLCAAAPGQTPWETASPESLGVSRAKLDAMRDLLAARGTKTLLVARRGKIVYEWYAPDWDAAKPHYTASLAKALVGGVSLLLAWNDGLLHPDDPAARYIPAWRDDPVKSRITIRHLATHSSGIEDAEHDGIPHADLPGWKGGFWRREPDPFSIAIRRAPAIFTPGARYAYSNTGMAALAYAVTASRKGGDIRSLLNDRVMAPLGVPGSEWSIGYGRTHEVDGLNLVANWGGGAFTARAAARVGQWMLQRGEWDRRPIVAPQLAAEAVSDARTPLPPRPSGNPQPASGLGWYTNFDGVWPNVPRDAFAGAGAGNQVLLVVPSLDLVAVRNGALLAAPDEAGFWGGIEKYLFDPLMEAVAAGASPPPYPPSPAIRRIDFAPYSAIRCDAVDSDNWPITWAGDDYLYTSYGDGWGFAPRTEKKLSQGFARIAGGPDDFRGENIRTPSGERTGDGAAGAKASGLLMVDGVLYAWVRNVNNSQLIWSADRGRTWQWGFRFETGFGSPAFLNFGPDYQGARDDFVYTYSQDGPSAYESDDGLALARVPNKRIRSRDSYEFFAHLDGAGQPVWTKNIAERGHVFSYAGHCQRVDAVYNPGLGRYLLALGYGHGGGWGIFDAPEPWGPWTTAFHADYWGLGDTHGYRLPSKWIADGGRTMTLVFSGRGPHNARLFDAFCVRRMTLDPPVQPRSVGQDVHPARRLPTAARSFYICGRP